MEPVYNKARLQLDQKDQKQAKFINSLLFLKTVHFKVIKTI